MKFTKIKNFTESNEVRIKAVTSKGVIINKLVIYIGKEIVDKHFSESNYVNVKIIKDKLGRNDIYLSKAASGSDLRKYKFAITDNGTCQTRKLLVSMPEDTDMNKYINNKAVAYESIDNNLILHIDSKTKSKKSKKINKNKLIVNGIDQATLDKPNKSNFDIEFKLPLELPGVCGDIISLGDQIKYGKLDHQTAKNIRKDNLTENNIETQNSSLISENVKYDSSIIELLYEFDFKNYSRYESLKGVSYEIKGYLDVNDGIQENILNKLDNIVKRLDFFDKNLAFLTPLCKVIYKLEDKIDTIISKNIPDENNLKELNNLGYDKLMVDLINYKNKTEERLKELENKVKNIKDDKRSLFDRIFGE